MYVIEKYKEGVITAQDGTVLVKIRCRISATDESIYNSLKKLSALIENRNPLYRVNTVFKNILDEKPQEDIVKPPTDLTYSDSPFTLVKHTYIVYNVVLTDEDVFGDAWDGVDRRVRIVWIDTDKVEHFVPLEGFDDESQAKNPHGAFSYNSETKELSFSQTRPYDTEYIIRRYDYVTT